ncbi:MAG: hypothetical protein NT086_18415 [Proteobacteria bacterium]|nr:hypothetical protein [Pseudomonadota bacterium]
MSIEIVGQQKYQFQDRVCILIGLMFMEDMQAQLHIEPKNGEDAQLNLIDGADYVPIEIQVKGSSTKIDMGTLASWMAHFPEHEASQSLLERVVHDKNRIALIIATARSDDASSVFCVGLDGDDIGSQRKLGSIKKIDVAALQTGFAKYAVAKKNDTTLTESRRNRINTYISGLAESALRQAAHRIKLVELIDDAKVEHELFQQLTYIHGMPPDVVSEILSKLEAIVVSEKRTGNDVLPVFRALISQYRPSNPLLPANYLKRGDEDELLSMLSKQGFLLLSGPPRIGKTSTARWIAANLQSKGYKVGIVESIDAAQRFLMDPVSEARLAIVDDPFGSAHPTDAPAREFAALERVLKSLPSNRKLVVAQAEDRLLEVTRKSKVAEIKIAGASWIPLENKVGNFLAQLWSQECKLQGVPSPLAERVRDILLSGALDLEPGCLVHLAVNHAHLSQDCSLEDIKRLARQDASALAMAFRLDGLDKVAAAMAVGTTQTRLIAHMELAFALGHGAPDRPGVVNVSGTKMSMGANSKTLTPLPDALFVYDSEPTLTDEQDTKLEQLEIRRIIELPMNKGYRFTHPSYRAGSELLLDADTHSSMSRALAIVERCLFSLSSDTANAAAANLSWIYERLNTSEAQEKIMIMAIDGMKSMWPDVREKCLQFLARRFGKCTDEQREEISSGGVWNVITFGRDVIKWANDRPFIPKPVGNVIETSFLGRPISKTMVEKTLTELSDTGHFSVSAEAAAEAAEFLSSNPNRATAHIISRLLSFELATLIRAPATKAWLCLQRENDEVLLAQIFSEEQPAIVSKAFKATVAVWWKCTQERRDSLRAGLVKMAGSPVSAFILIGHLVKFERPEETGNTPPWPLFEALMPVVLTRLTILPMHQAARLYAVMEVAIKHIEPAVSLAIVDAWITFLMDFAKRTQPDDFLLGVTTIMLDSTENDPSYRAKRVASLLRVPGTGARIRIVTDLVDRWNDLTPEEHTSVIEQLTVSSQDENWLRAAAISRPLVPEVVQHAILPEGIDLGGAAEDLVRTLSPNLLKAIVRLYASDHPAIEYSASRRFAKNVWEPVLKAVAEDANHPCFRQALWYLISSRNNHLSELISLLGKEQADLVFDMLLEYVTHSGGEFLTEAWGGVFGLDLDDEIREEYFQKMVEVAPMATNSYNELEKWVPIPYRQEFLEQFTGDLVLINLAHHLFVENFSSTVIREEGWQMYTKLVREFPPLLWYTYELLSNKMENHKAHCSEFLEELRVLGSAARSLSLKKPKQIYEPLDNWLHAGFDI